MGADAIGGALNHFNGGPVGELLANQLDHVPWAGFRAYDLIFPLFLFMVGVSIPFSLTKFAAVGTPSPALPRILRRTALLFLLGLYYYGGLSKSFSDLRLLGVLQRIALCYGASCLLWADGRTAGMARRPGLAQAAFQATSRWVRRSSKPSAT